MATVDGRPALYGLSLKQLRELMEVRGHEAVEIIRQHGGVQEICKKLYTSPTEGSYIDDRFFFLINNLRACARSGALSRLGDNHKSSEGRPRV